MRHTMILEGCTFISLKERLGVLRECDVCINFGIVPAKDRFLDNE